MSLLNACTCAHVRLSQTGCNVNSGKQLSLNTWYHIAVVRCGSAWKMYVDGELDWSGELSVIAAPLYKVM